MQTHNPLLPLISYHVAEHNYGNNRVHGHRGGDRQTPTYNSWIAMKSRCSNPKNNRYKYYGAQGITVCDRWKGKDGFKNFLADMGEKPSTAFSINRIDNSKGYSPENCNWATSLEQARNRRKRGTAMEGRHVR